MTDPYAVLGLAPRATEAEVRRAYRSLVRSLHPDLRPAHLRADYGVQLTAVNDARAQVLEEIRARRPEPPTRSTSSPRSAADRPTVPAQRPHDDGARQHARRAVWLSEQRRVVEEWHAAGPERVERRRRQLRLQRPPRRGALWALLPVLLLLTGQVLLAVGVVRGVEALGAWPSVRADHASSNLDQLDLQELLARWGSWRS